MISEPAEQEIREVIAAWLKASAEDDLESVLSLMADDVIFLLPGQPPMTKAVFAAASREMAGQMHLEGRSDIHEIHISGPYAYCWSHLSITVTPTGEGSPKQRAGDVLSIFRQEPDGRWLLFRDANLSVPIE